MKNKIQNIDNEANLKSPSGDLGVLFDEANSVWLQGVGGQVFTRFRQFRIDAATRDRYADINDIATDFIYPYFIVEGENEIQPIKTLKGISRFSIDQLLIDLEETIALGIDRILLFWCNNR